MPICSRVEFNKSITTFDVLNTRRQGHPVPNGNSNTSVTDSAFNIQFTTGELSAAAISTPTAAGATAKTQTAETSIAAEEAATSSRH